MTDPNEGGLSWTEPTLRWKESMQAWRLMVILRFLALIFIGAAALYALLPLAGIPGGFFGLMPFLSNSAVKVSILAALCLYAAADLRLRHKLVLIVIIGHVISVVAMVLMILVPALAVAADINQLVTVPFVHEIPLKTLLWQLCALDGVITVILVLAYLPIPKLYLDEVKPCEPPHWPPPSEQILRRVLQLLAIIFAASAIGYEIGVLFYPSFFKQIPFVTNSVVKISTLAMTAWFVSRDTRNQLALVGPIILVHWVSVAVQLVYLTFGGSLLDEQFTLFGQSQTMGQILLGAVILDGVLALILTGLYQSAWRGRFNTKFLRPLEYRTLQAIADIMVGTDQPAVPPLEIARNVDEHLADVRTERRFLFRLVLILNYYLPLLALRAPLAEMGREVRERFLKSHFYRDPNQRWWQWYLGLIQTGTRVGHQLTALGYYNDPRAHREIGYQIFTDRPTTPRELDRPENPLMVLRPWNVDGEVIDDNYDVCVIGTGAGGATAAYALAEGGMKVLMIERGQYIESRHFTEDELFQICNLYDRGMLQVAEDFKFSVLQGNCVGGSTTVNNAICFAPPTERLLEWQAAAPGLNIAEMQAATDWLRHFLRIQSIANVPHHKAANVLVRDDATRHRVGVTKPVAFECNIAVDPTQPPGLPVKPHPPRCYGCGNCNIGCGWDRKLSMLDHTLPLGQTSFQGKLHILAECEANRLRYVSTEKRASRVTELVATLSDGRRVAVRAKRFIVSGGAINSSYLLLQSGIGGLGSGVPVGRGLAFNMITPVFAEFEEPMNSFAGIQMGHYLKDERNRFIIETWFSPPIGLATAMGGWFDDHHANMKRASHMVAYGMVVGTENNGRVFEGPTGPTFRYSPTEIDRDKMKAGLYALGEMLFAGGAKRMLLNTWDHGSIWSRDALSQIDRYLGKTRTLTVASSHPQGGNAIGGVVDHNLMVKGFDNLYVADASVFPGSVQVNPQLSVMTAARYAALRILHDRRS